jgi:hypothetical protein
LSSGIDFPNTFPSGFHIMVGPPSSRNADKFPSQQMITKRPHVSPQPFWLGGCSDKGRATGHAICGYGTHDQAHNSSADHQEANEYRATMYVAAPLSGNDVAEREADKASAREPCS